MFGGSKCILRRCLDVQGLMPLNLVWKRYVLANMPWKGISMLDFRSVRLLKSSNTPRKLKPMEAEVHFKNLSKQEDDANIFRVHVGQIRKSTWLILTGVRRWSRNASHVCWRLLHPQIAAWLLDHQRFLALIFSKSVKLSQLVIANQLWPHLHRRNIFFGEGTFSTIWSNLELVFCSNKLPKFTTPFWMNFCTLWLIESWDEHPKNFIKVRKIFQGIVLPVCTRNCSPFWKIAGNFLKSCLFCLLLIRIRASLLLMEEILHQSIPKRSHLIIGFYTSQEVQDFSNSPQPSHSLSNGSNTALGTDLS